jgi:hypothetical protein
MTSFPSISSISRRNSAIQRQFRSFFHDIFAESHQSFSKDFDWFPHSPITWNSVQWMTDNLLWSGIASLVAGFACSSNASLTSRF